MKLFTVTYRRADGLRAKADYWAKDRAQARKLAESDGLDVLDSRLAKD